MLSAAAVATILLASTVNAFAPVLSTTVSSTQSITLSSLSSSSTSLKAKRSKSKGFGKQQVETTSSSSSSSSKSKPSVAKDDGDDDTAATSTAPETRQSNKDQAKPFLQSVDEDESTDPEERAKALLREKYGMKTLAEQQLDAKQLEARKEQQQKLADWKARAERGEDFDIMSVLPGPVLSALFNFLKIGTAMCTVVFVSAGVLITVEAGSKALESPLPETVDSFIVSTVEPNFTPGLFVLLAFSVSLGIFAALQLGSQGSTYKED